MVLFTIGFIAITVALLMVQPGSNRRQPYETLPPAEVTRADPRLDAVAQAIPVEIPPAPPPVATFVPSRVALPADGPLDDEALRRLTWATLAGINHATGRDAAPGQPGSLLHMIVQRSLAETGDAAAAPSPGVYFVKPGDSLASIAQALYGDVNMTGPLFAANQSILARPDDLRPGQRLTLPE
ncbi:LysM peptidoglycan-binding domain-containing protein [Thetidibacter halocola]|nr:LysM peptidoglycan-binding domain-containing protein [Thetidibacter halocola]